MVEHVNIEPRGKDRRGVERWRLWVSAGTDPATGRRRRLSKTFHGKISEAVREQRRWQTDIDAGAGLTPGGRTVADTLDAYLKLERVLKWTPATVGKNRTIVAHLKRLLGPVKLTALVERPGEITAAYQHALNMGQHSATTINSWHDVLRAALAYEVRPRGPLLFNPAEHATVPSRDKVKTKVPKPAVVQAVLAAAAQTDLRLHTFLRLSAAAGSRRGETVAIRARHIDEHGVLTIESAVSVGARRKIDTGQTKTKRDRRVVLGPKTLAVVQARIVECELTALAAGAVFGPDSYLFSNDVAGREPVWPAQMGKELRRVARTVGVELTLKSFRRFVTTQLLDNGIDQLAVQARQGHSPEVMARHYYDTPDPTAQRAAILLDDILG